MSTEWPLKVDEATFVCEVPHQLGRIVKLRHHNGKLVASTASGVDFIVPVAQPPKPG
jgi:hypothetical protein